LLADWKKNYQGALQIFTKLLERLLGELRKWAALARNDVNDPERMNVDCVSGPPRRLISREKSPSTHSPGSPALRNASSIPGGQSSRVGRWVRSNRTGYG
jgi:hypothetical protein